jgi:hypothetical protein
MATLVEKNGKDLAKELEWLRQLIEKRLHAYFGNEELTAATLLANAPAIKKGSTYADFVLRYGLDLPSRVVLILSLAPHLKPEILDVFFARNTVYDKKFTEFGGVPGAAHQFLPTGETVLFILAGSDLEDRFGYYPLLTHESVLVKNSILHLEPVNRHEPFLNGKLTLMENYGDYFITGELTKPGFGEDFPARLVTTEQVWEDVILSKPTYESVSEIRQWVDHGHTVLGKEGLGKRLKPGFKSLFYGPPGTGKTMTATLIGKSTGHDVYKVDLSMVVSKYIGETEKNLSKIFDQAQHRQWILFFDEADALFGKRTSTNSSNDRYANQEVAYLLQRIEEHPGIVILASNLKDNIDPAFTRRFQSVIHFAMPGTEERYAIWKKAFSKDLPLEKDVDLRAIAEKYEISGGLMMNVIRYCSLKAVANKKKTIPLEDIEAGIRRELVKDGILLS